MSGGYSLVPCVDCAKPIRKRPTGKCRDCVNADRRANSRHCGGCQTQIKSDNLSGYCKPCYSAKSRETYAKRREENGPEIARLFSEGVTASEIAARFHMGKERTLQMLAELGLEPKPRRQAKPSQPPQEARNRRIVAEYERGATATAIARSYGLSIQRIGIILDQYNVQKRHQQRMKSIELVVPSLGKRIHCGQCDRSVTIAEGEACNWRFCKGREARAA